MDIPDIPDLPTVPLPSAATLMPGLIAMVSKIETIGQSASHFSTGVGSFQRSPAMVGVSSASTLLSSGASKFIGKTITDINALMVDISNKLLMGGDDGVREAMASMSDVNSKMTEVNAASDRMKDMFTPKMPKIPGLPKAPSLPDFPLS